MSNLVSPTFHLLHGSLILHENVRSENGLKKQLKELTRGNLIWNERILKSSTFACICYLVLIGLVSHE